MKYLLITEADIVKEEELEDFIGRVESLDFDKLVFVGDMASCAHTESLYRALNPLYVKGNVERFVNRNFLKDSVDLEGYHIEHGHRFDPTYHRLNPIKYAGKNAAGDFFLKTITSLRGAVKGAYNSVPNKLGEEGIMNDFGKTMEGSKFSNFAKSLFLRHLYKKLPEKSIISHFHLFSGAYKMRDKTLAILPVYPRYATLEDGALEFHKPTT